MSAVACWRGDGADAAPRPPGRHAVRGCPGWVALLLRRSHAAAPPLLARPCLPDGGM